MPCDEDLGCPPQLFGCILEKVAFPSATDILFSIIALLFDHYDHYDQNVKVDLEKSHDHRCALDLQTFDADLSRSHRGIAEKGHLWMETRWQMSNDGLLASIMPGEILRGGFF